MTFKDDIVLQHLVQYPSDPDVTIHSLACEKECSLVDAKNMLKRKAKNYLSKKDYYRYFDGDVEVDEYLFANAATRLQDAQAEVASKFPLRASLTCDELQDSLYEIDEAITTAIEQQSGKRGARLYNEILERELGRRKGEFQRARRSKNCLEVEATQQEIEDTILIGQLGDQTASLKRGTEGGSRFLFVMIGVGIVGLAVVAAFASKKGK